MLCGYLYSAPNRKLLSGALDIREGRWKEKFSNYIETQVISPVASHSGVQEECHSRVKDPP